MSLQRINKKCIILRTYMLDIFLKSKKHKLTCRKMQRTKLYTFERFLDNIMVYILIRKCVRFKNTTVQCLKLLAS